MGFGNKFKALRDQAQHAMVENRDKIQGAVQSAGELANLRTGGKYAAKIEKVSDRVNAGVDKLGGAPADQGGTDADSSPEAASEAQPSAASSATSTFTQPAQPAPDHEAKADRPAPGAPPEFE